MDDGDLFGLFEQASDTAYTTTVLYFAKGSSSGVHVFPAKGSIESAKAVLEGPLEWHDPPAGLTVENMGNWVWKRRIDIAIIHGDESQAIAAVAYINPRTEAPSD